jgi:hypothetical protein
MTTVTVNDVIINSLCVDYGGSIVYEGVNYRKVLDMGYNLQQRFPQHGFIAVCDTPTSYILLPFLPGKCQDLMEILLAIKEDEIKNKSPEVNYQRKYEPLP